MDSFFTKSRQIADKFIQSVLFVDDEIYEDGGNDHNRLDAKSLVTAFSKAKKLCALNNPKTENDLNDIIEVAHIADIIVLDWRINLLDDQENEIDEENDIEEDDQRGKFTLKLINELLLNNSNELKLIMIYTGEPSLPQIVETILTEFVDFHMEQISPNMIGKANFRIVVSGKPTLENRLNHNPELKEWIVGYEDIPDFLITQFTHMTSGLVSNMALHGISTIRNNSFKLLNFYNKTIDPAFLSHRALLPLVDDAGNLLKDSLLTSLKAILDYEEIEQICSFNLISKWIDQNSFTDKSIRISGKELVLSKREIKKWQKEGFLSTIPEIWAEQFPDKALGKLEDTYRSLHKTSLSYFLPDGIPSDNIEEDFSILTHHKSNYANPTYVPRLSLGTIIKGAKSGEYLLCIQQKCDSVRIKEEEARRFLFLPLNKVEDGKNFNFLVVESGQKIKLKVVSDTHKIKTIKFKANKEEAVYARKFGTSEKYFFKPLYSKGHSDYKKKIDQNFIWIMDLKDDHAQRIANNYASKLSRVGLDESEWLRRWSGN